MHDETLISPMREHLQLHASQFKQKTQHPSRPIYIHTYNILHHPIFKNACYTTHLPTNSHTVTATDIKANMRHIHTSIVSVYLAKRGNNKILRTTLPHINIYGETRSRLTRLTLNQLIMNKSPFLKSYLHKVDANSHPPTLCPLCNRHPQNTHHLFNCTHTFPTLSSLYLLTDPARVMELHARWTEKLTGGPQAGRLYSTPLARVKGVGRQQLTHYYRTNIVRANPEKTQITTQDNNLQAVELSGQSDLQIIVHASFQTVSSTASQIRVSLQRLSWLIAQRCRNYPRTLGYITVWASGFEI